MARRTVRLAALVLSATLLVGAGMAVFPLCRCTDEMPPPSGPAPAPAVFDDAAPGSVRDRLGVVIVGSSKSIETTALPLGWYKDYGIDGQPLTGHGGPVAYTPVVQYQGKRDTAWRRALLRFFWHLGYIPHNTNQTICSTLDTLSLERFEKRIQRDAQRYPPGTLFLLGSEPGYRWADDDRTPQEIVDDAKVIRKALEAVGRGYRLALGGISTPSNRQTRLAYGMEGMAFFEAILDAAGDFEFDAFVIHPYPSDLARASFEDSRRQIIEFRKVMAARGLQDRPLLVGEVGIPFTGAREADVLLFAEQLLDFCLNHRDPDIGQPQDDFRLVQRSYWFLLSPPTMEVPGFTDNPAMDFHISALLTYGGKLTKLGRGLSRLTSSESAP